MRIEFILSEYLQRYGIESVNFSTDGVFYAYIESLGHVSCEQTEDGIIFSIMQDMPLSEQKKFMKKSLENLNPLVAKQEITLRPILYRERAGFVVPIEADNITVQHIDKVVQALHSMLRKMGSSMGM